MDAGGRAEGISADDRVIKGDGNAALRGYNLTVFCQADEFPIRPAEQVEIDQQDFHRCVAAALADAQPAGVDSIRSRFNRGQRIDNVESAIFVAVPINPDVWINLIHHLAQGGDQRTNAAGRDVANRIGGANAPGAGADGGGVHLAQRGGVGAGGVLGDEHHRQAVFDREIHRFFRPAQQEVYFPVLCILTDGAGA